MEERDTFCSACGASSNYNQWGEEDDPRFTTAVSEARLATGVLSFALILGAIFVFVMSYGDASSSLDMLSSMAADTPWELDGELLTVSELRTRIQFELWGSVAINLVLAGVMIGLRVWATTKPFEAMITAASVYGALLVIGVLMDPTTICQGIVIKIIVIAALYRGLKAAIAVRGEYRR